MSQFEIRRDRDTSSAGLWTRTESWMPAEGWAPFEKRLVLWSFGTGLLLLAILAVFHRHLPAGL